MFRVGNIKDVLLYFGKLYMKSVVKKRERGAMFDIKEFFCV